MSELNERQEVIAKTLNGPIVVDAGPGTGKTHTIVERYINIISQDDVSPRDVLLLTFTTNAAAEMDERIKKRMAEAGMEKDSKLVQTKTFDAFCLSVVLDSPDLVSSFFGFSEKLTRSATLYQNDTLNRDYFIRFLDDFLYRKGSDYGDTAVLASGDPVTIMKLIYKLMSRGLIPLRTGWFGKDWQADLEGDTETIRGYLEQRNTLNDKGVSENMEILAKIDEDAVYNPPTVTVGSPLDAETLDSAARPERGELFRFIHDVYYEYIRRSISDNRLTFGLNAMLAFTVLYSKESVRERNSFRYLMVDEFQDTNANQMMISLMILKEPNLCVVGDWKQGIYGFRFVSIDNILNFEEKCVEMRRFLNDDLKRVQFQIPEVTKLSLDVNYRSSQLIIDKAYECIFLKGSKTDEVNEGELREKVVYLKQGRTDLKDETAIRFVQSDSQEQEVDEVIAAIKDYVFSGKYTIVNGDSRRNPGFGDIAIICRNTKHCRMIMTACENAGIPAYLQGDVQIMSTREGKLTLAWLRFVNNERDPWGYVPIMVDMGYTPPEIRKASKMPEYIPETLIQQRDALYLKRRRITELLTSMFSFYRLDNDITQAIITTVSSLHSGSLLTISDIIRVIEDDIESGSTYSVENFIDSKAVTIMTMHKAKGLEFPIVITPFIDFKTMPSEIPDRSVFTFDELCGVRCTKEIGKFGDYSKICTDWRTRLAKASVKTDYSEERRLMFVALSRAKQYETVICGHKPSAFMKGLSSEDYEDIPSVDTDIKSVSEGLIDAPPKAVYEKRCSKLGVHEILNFDNGEGESNSSGCDEVCGKGMEYGTEIHKLAQIMCQGGTVDETKYPELPVIRGILDSLKDADILYPEIECGLPVPGEDTTLRGVIDLLALYPDHVEIHDYKTDVSDRFEQEYVVQLSVYAYAAQQFYDKPVECYIDYVSRGCSKRIDIVCMDEIAKRVHARTHKL
ncbi:MAG: hypothetical protein E7Z64_05610 [Thermoplasmata archaeon]|nr:hypothetical protein [Thermoplasmata archaeon]